MASQEVQDLITKIQSVTPASDADRQLLYKAGRDLVGRWEDTFEATNRIVYAPQLLYVTKTAVDLGLFKILSQNSPKSMSVEEVATASPAKPDPLLVKRILRYLASQYSVTQVDAKHYTANDLTKALSTEAYQGGIVHSADCLMLCAEALPKFFKQTAYKNPADSASCPFQLALKTDLQAWTWSMGQPELTAQFAVWMQAQTRPGESWIDVVDVPALLKGSTAETPIFVDVGGSIGHQSVIFKSRFPNVPGRVILQDLEGPIGASIPHDGIEKSVVDFWQPQMVKGARIYYLRHILHDWTDEKAVELLKITKAACGPDSVIIIDEMVLPDTDAHWRATAMDINMLSSVAALERTESDWLALLKGAGLTLRQCQMYQPGTALSAMVVQ